MIKLEKFKEADFDRFIGWIPNELFMYQFAGPAFSFPITKIQLEEYIAVPNRKVYTVFDTAAQEFVGHGELNNIDSRNRSARICRILIAKNTNRNKGYGQLLINELLRIAFEELNLHRIDLGVFESNRQAIKCYENCGFQKEGLFRDSFLIEGEYHSTYNMSILKNEWLKK